MAQKILNEDWSEYDDRKIRDGRDRSKFSCEENWEVDYLVQKLRKHFPFKTDSALKAAIAECCKTVAAPRPREKFVTCVYNRLSN